MNIVKNSPKEHQKAIISKRPLRVQIRENASSYAFLTPWLLGFFGLTLFPILYSLYLSFTQYNIISAPIWIGLRNYFVMFIGNAEIPRDERFMNSLIVTFRFVFISVPAKLVFALAVAMLMNQKLKGISFYRTIYYIPTLLAAPWQSPYYGGGSLQGTAL